MSLDDNTACLSFSGNLTWDINDVKVGNVIAIACRSY